MDFVKIDEVVDRYVSSIIRKNISRALLLGKSEESIFKDTKCVDSAGVKTFFYKACVRMGLVNSSSLVFSFQITYLR